MAAQPGIRISKLVEKTGVTRATIHHYVKEGLLPEPVKSSRNMALYHPDCIERVLLIKSLQQTYRRSLAEVKELLDRADEHKGLKLLKEQLATGDSAQPPELRADRPQAPLERDALLKRTGFSSADLKGFVKGGLVSPDADGRFSPLDVDVMDALAELHRIGFSEDAGFTTEDAAIYVEAMRDLITKESDMFLRRAGAAVDPDALVEMARAGLERVTPLMLAIRRKMLVDLVTHIPTPETRKKR